jgi:hypothetical protein
MRLKLQKTLFIGLILLFTNSYSQDYLWKTQEINGKLNNHSVSSYLKNHSKTLVLDFKGFKKQLQNVPFRGVSSKSSNIIINLPDDKGTLQAFRILEAPVFSPSLAVKYSQIKSYVGFSTDNSGATVRMSVSPKGVQTMISYKDRPTVFMQPLNGEVKKYVVYNRLSKNSLPKDEFICSTADELVNASEIDKNNISQRDADDQILRKFRLALSVNGEYTTYHGGTVVDALSAINATMTRVNAVFETDMAVTFEVQDFPELIYIDASLDPYSNSLSNWNLELQNTLTNTIGNAAYDIGHMFGGSGGGGNAGCIGCVCVDDTESTFDENKGAGITSPADGNPQGDTFDIDYVAHEIGHQMGALHTWSHSSAGGLANIEPGSGSTIMGYAGITGSDVQPHSDLYFSYFSIKQITDNVTNVRTCWQANSPLTITNNPPNANAGDDVFIPQGTAYVLRGSATDADNADTLMYCWEQNDDGVVTISNFGPSLSSGAMARSLPPTTSSDRYIPKLSRVVAGQLTETNPTDGGGSDWETVSTVARDLNWALTVRDREPTDTGLYGQSSFDLMKITVDASAGPFVVTSQTTNITWDAGSSKTITWDVAGTDSGNVNTTKVNIFLSKDGGLTFPITLASDVDNDGSHSFIVPVTNGADSNLARIIVEGKDNVFYAMNSSNFSIQESEFAMAVSNPEVDVCSPDDAVYNFTYNTFLGFSDVTVFTATDLPTGASVAFNPATATADDTSVIATISGISAVEIGQYNFKIIGSSGAIVKEADVILNVSNGVPNNLTLASPADGNTGEPVSPTLIWNADSNASSYDVEVAIDDTFTTIISSENVTTTSFTVPGLNQVTTYYWRVKGVNSCGEGDFSNVFSFTTVSCTVCASIANTTYETSTTYVKFNTIENTSTKQDDNLVTQGYFDYTSISSDVTLNESHDLTVHVNTDGNYRVQVKAWIDWNQNCSFDDDGEEYDLGFATNTADGPTDLSPFTITVPAGANLGNTVMRVSSKYTSSTTVVYPESCEAAFDGEVEDYTINVQDATASLEDFSFAGFNLYPNPTKGAFTLNLEVINTAKVSVQLYDVRGRLIDEKEYYNTNTNFSKKILFEKASAGLYLLKVTNGNKQTTRKLMIR